MTIAACYLSADGVVFGADSTTTMFVSGIGPAATGSEHHYNFAQKIFQIGEDSTLAMTMWGLGNLQTVSYRTLIAQFADSLESQEATSMSEVADRWNQMFWSAYSADMADITERARVLDARTSRSLEEDEELSAIRRAFSGGFCVGGYLLKDRTPRAYEILFEPAMQHAASPAPLNVGRTRFWGCPNLIERLLMGIDGGVFQALLSSKKWTGTPDDLFELLQPHVLGQPFDLPIREAIDWVHASIYSTIKTMKFSHMAPVCGGPVEVAVITTDRRFRWVKHKGLDAAVRDGGFGYASDD